MKRSLTLLILTFSAITVFGQENGSHPSNSGHGKQMAENIVSIYKSDCVFMINGKMLMMKEGRTTDMPDDVLLNNGDVVSKNGSIKMKDGTTRTLKNGDSVDLNGKIEKMHKR